MIDIKQLTQQKNQLKDVWDYLGIDTPFPDKQVRQWLLKFDSNEIVSAFEVLANREDAVEDPVRYVGKVLTNAKLQNMTVEEREAHISAVRSLAGAIGARRGHEAKLKAIRKEFDKGLPDFAGNLPEVSQTFAGGLGVGVGVGSGVEPVLEAVTGAEPKPPHAAAIAASRLAPTAKEEKKNLEPTPTPKPNPNSGYGVSANQTPTPKTNTNPGQRVAQPYQRKCRKCGEALDPTANHTCSVVKTKDQAMAKAQGGWYPGDAGCQGCGMVRRSDNSDWCEGCWITRQKAKAKAASAPLGNVDEL